MRENMDQKNSEYGHIYIPVEGQNRRFYTVLYFTFEINTQYLLLVYYFALFYTVCNVF